MKNINYKINKPTKTLTFTKFLMLVISFLVVMGVRNVRGQVTLPHHDPINYIVGQGLQTQTGWTQLNSGDNLLITTGSLSYSGLIASTYNKVTFDGAGIDAAKLFTQQTSGTVYYSFLLNITSLGSLTTSGGYFTGFNEGTSTNYGGTVWLRSDGSGIDIGINPRTTASNTQWSSGTTPINNTLFIVISYQIVSGSSNDVMKLWINTTPGGTEPSATLTATNTGTDLTNINRIFIRQDGVNTTPFIEMDELRIGTTWASVTPTGSTNSTSSDIIRNTSFSEPVNIAYGSYQSTNIINDGNSLEVAKFDIRDGGGVADADALGTSLTDITFTVSNWANIRKLAIYDGTTEVSEVSVSIGTVIFSGLAGLTAADGSSKTFTLRASFNTSVTDNQQFQFTISSATANASGSSFATGNAGGAFSSIAGNSNKIIVTATKLLFVQQPTTTNVSTAMTPNPTVKACDANNNTDVDYSAAVSVTSTGTLTGSPVAGSWSSGVAIFSSLTHTATGTGLTLNATSSGITNATSNTFDIIDGPCLSEGFNGGTTPPSGWSFTGITSVYNTPGNYGASSPSLSMDNTNDKIVTPTVTNATQLKFWIKGQSTNSSSALLVEGWNGSSWVTIQNITNSIPTTGTTYTYNSSTSPALAAGFSQFRFTYTKSSGNLAFDDVEVLCGVCTEPTINSTGISFSNITNTSLDITIATPGNGSKRIIVSREGAAVSFTPTDNNTYEANPIFSDAIDLGSGNKVVYNGSGTTATISGLNGNTTYYFKVYEYNCSEGSEDYYTGGTLLVGHTTTAVSPVTNLKVNCQTNTTAEITWTSPVGDYDGVIIGMRNSTLQCHTMSGDASIYSGNVVFGTGTQYGTPSPPNPYSYVVYKGTGTSVTVTGLTAGQPYQITAYAYKNATGSIWATTQPTTAITSLGTANVSNNIVAVDNAQLLLQWANPGASCFDEVMIVANVGVAITTVPTGDGSAYTANLTYGSGTPYGTGFVVYKGSLSPQTITNLTNNTSYCFTWFTRNGTSWSSGVSACGTPAAVTTLYSGDLAIVAVNTQCETTGSNDEICFFAFKDITEGTSIDFTDNGYERLYADKWASSEGTIRLTRNAGAPTIPKGTVICFQGAGSLQSQFEIFNCGDPDDANWTITSINNVDATRGSYDLNVDDQIWILQSGAWDNDGSLSAHNATYSGNVLYGWTATGWKSAPGYDDTKGSTLYPSSECFATNVSVTSYHSKVKYTGSMTPTTQFDWLLRLNNSSNWTGYGASGNTNAQNNALYNAGGNNYVGDCITFDITDPISTTSGVWTGSYSSDWFYCGNWENLRIPTGTSNVTIKSGATTNIVIDDGITSMPTAECNDFTLDNAITLTVNNTSSNFIVYGNFDNASTVNFTNGAIHLKGNYTNTGTFDHSTAGTLFFDGSSPQNITGTANFFNLTINNTSSGVNLSNDISVNNNLTLTNGTINTGSNLMQFGTSTTNRGGTLNRTNGYINGNMKRWFAAATNSGTTGLFPIGATLLVNGGPNSYLPTQIEFTTAPTVGGSLTAKFETNLPVESDYYLGLPKTDLNDGMDPHQVIDNLPDEGFWIITAGDGLISGVTGGEYTISLTGNGLNTIGDISKVRVLKRDNYGTNWELLGNHGSTTGVSVTRTGLFGFSQFAMGGKYTENPLPINLLNFSAKYNGSIVDLNWTTASETNNDFFTIERSVDASSFNAITSIKGAGNSNSIIHYSALDAFPLKGINYYRLKQTDYNSKSAFSKIISVNTIDNNCELEINQLYLQNNTLYLTLNCIDSKICIDIVDITGRIVYSQHINVIDKSQNITLNLPALTKGVYFAKVTSDKTVVVKKFNF